MKYAKIISMETINIKMPLWDFYKVIGKKGTLPFWGIKITKKSIRVYHFIKNVTDYNGNKTIDGEGVALKVDHLIAITFKNKLKVNFSEPFDLRIMIHSLQDKSWTLVPDNEISPEDLRSVPETLLHWFFKKNPREIKYMVIKTIYS
jgi:hypothetical protein